MEKPVDFGKLEVIVTEEQRLVMLAICREALMFWTCFKDAIMEVERGRA